MCAFGCNAILRLSYSNKSVLQLNPCGLRQEPNYVQLQLQWREVERKELEVKREKRELADAMCAYYFPTQRGAREGREAMVAREKTCNILWVFFFEKKKTDKSIHVTYILYIFRTSLTATSNRAELRAHSHEGQVQAGCCLGAE